MMRKFKIFSVIDCCLAIRFYRLCKSGELLDKILARGGKYSEEDAKAVMVQILRVTTYCHLQDWSTCGVSGKARIETYFGNSNHFTKIVSLSKRLCCYFSRTPSTLHQWFFAMSES
ncbi:hypothetical protein L2E82_12371 [Cichorium intybus]|uniref:Uncharacterized protein n=1 Tax=Cichorium intybus TaxID=13427 RepID=A0ACB9GH06_CICIN|nr:hypothetical protein L2E82_12371 [Cichorium intybus]